MEVQSSLHLAPTQHSRHDLRSGCWADIEHMRAKCQVLSCGRAFLFKFWCSWRMLVPNWKIWLALGPDEV